MNLFVIFGLTFIGISLLISAIIVLSMCNLAARADRGAGRDEAIAIASDDSSAKDEMIAIPLTPTSAQVDDLVAFDNRIP